MAALLVLYPEVAVFLLPMRSPTPEEIQRLRVSTRGFNRALLAEYGIPWPPPSGWRKALIKKQGVSEDSKEWPKYPAGTPLDDQLMYELIQKTKEKKLTWSKWDNRTYSAFISKAQVVHLTHAEIIFKTPEGCGHRAYSHALCNELFKLVQASDKAWALPLESALEALKAR